MRLRSSYRYGLVALATGLLLPALVAAQGTDDLRPGVAVMPFAIGGSYGPNREDFSDLQVGLQQMLLTEIAQNSGLRVVDRSILRGILEELDLVRAGHVDAQTAARVGKMVGARYIVTGAFMDLFGNFRIDGRIVDVETSEVLKTEEVRDKPEKIYDLIVELASRITTGVELPPLAAGIKEARKAREIPAEAVRLYSQAQVLEDGGQPERAIELYRLLADRFPQMIEAREALRQLTET